MSPVRGARKPTHRLVPAAADRSAGREAVALLVSLGVELDAWQRDTLVAAMGRDRSRRWSADEVCLLCPRQNGKSLVLLGAALWHAVAASDRLILFTSHESKTNLEQFSALQDELVARKTVLRSGGRPLAAPFAPRFATRQIDVTAPERTGARRRAPRARQAHVARRSNRSTAPPSDDPEPEPPGELRLRDVEPRSAPQAAGGARRTRRR